MNREPSIDKMITVHMDRHIWHKNDFAKKVEDMYYTAGNADSDQFFLNSSVLIVAIEDQVKSQKYVSKRKSGSA